MKSTFKKLQFFLFLLFLFSLWSCKTTNALSRENFTPEEPYHLEENISFVDVEEPYKYIFLRIYNPIYKNPFYYANILRTLIGLTEVTDYTASHASIGFSLDDNFYGLSGSGDGRLKIEHCTNISDNVYMKNCNPDKSDEITLAIKVRESEYFNIKKYVESCLENPNFKYDVGINFSIANIAINRKFFAKKENKQFGTVKYPKKRYKNDKPEERFVCCTFIAYALINYIPEFNTWFEENNVDYHLLTVTDLLFLPYTVPLFYSSWNDYDLAASAFVEHNPEFSSYLNN